MVSVTFLNVCCQSYISFSCRHCGYSGLVDYIILIGGIFLRVDNMVSFCNLLQVSGCCVEI